METLSHRIPEKKKKKKDKEGNSSFMRFGDSMK